MPLLSSTRLSFCELGKFSSENTSSIESTVAIYIGSLLGLRPDESSSTPIVDAVPGKCEYAIHIRFARPLRFEGEAGFAFQARATSAQMAKNTTKVHKDVIKLASLSTP